MIIYRGKSLIDGTTPIVGVLTGVLDPSSNTKTGPMAQLWILREDKPAGRTLDTGEDAAVCGACPFAHKRGCYVAPMATAAIWKSVCAGTYGSVIDPVEGAKLLVRQHRRGAIQGLRIGAYGDPVALPLGVVEDLATPLREAGAAITGYTHAWRDAYRISGQPEPEAGWRQWLMASCHHQADMLRAKLSGWRPYVILGEPPEGVDPYTWAKSRSREWGVALCPAASERPEHLRLTCGACGGCNGKGMDDRRVGFGISLHGGAASVKVARISQRKLAGGE